MTITNTNSTKMIRNVIIIIIIRLLRIAITKATGYINQKKIRIHKCYE